MITSCEICLLDYKVEEEVCWSPNIECKHAFHRECIVHWLLKNQTCPICRRDYLQSNANICEAASTSSVN